VLVGDEVEHHGIALGLHFAGHFQFLLERLAGAGQHVVDRLVRGLKADLDMVQPRFTEGGDAVRVEADAGGDQVGVVAQRTCLGDQLFQIASYQRFATGEAELRGPHLARLTEHLDPLVGAQLVAVLGKVQRVAAVRALQRTLVG